MFDGRASSRARFCIAVAAGTGRYLRRTRGGCWRASSGSAGSSGWTRWNPRTGLSTPLAPPRVDARLSPCSVVTCPDRVGHLPPDDPAEGFKVGGVPTHRLPGGPRVAEVFGPPQPVVDQVVSPGQGYRAEIRAGDLRQLDEPSPCPCYTRVGELGSAPGGRPDVHAAGTGRLERKATDHARHVPHRRRRRPLPGVRPPGHERAYLRAGVEPLTRQ